MGATLGDVITPGNEKAFTVKNKNPGALKDLPPQYKQLLSDPVTASLTTVSAKGDIQYIDTGVVTDVDLRIGQKVVVGKAAIGNARDSLFIVISAKLVE